MFRFEWIIVELLVLGLLVFELIRTRRAVRKDKDAAARSGRNTEPKRPD